MIHLSNEVENELQEETGVEGKRDVGEGRLLRRCSMTFDDEVSGLGKLSN